jgi:hypothetical protein
MKETGTLTAPVMLPPWNDKDGSTRGNGNDIEAKRSDTSIIGVFLVSK